MDRIKWLLVALALGLLLIGCGVDPKRVEEAGAIRRESEALYLSTATAVAIQADFAGIQARATATAVADKEAVRAATQDDRIARSENLVWWSSVAGVLVILALGLAIGVASIGGASAFAYWTKQQARLVWMSKATRTWPVMLDTKTGWLVDLETGERAKLGDVQQVDHRRLVISGQVRVTGLLAQAAVAVAKSTKNAQPGDMLAAIGQSVPLLEAGSVEE